jgi:O-acetyl-ADP-ribose deacetylase (regulator of RNase III)
MCRIKGNRNRSAEAGTDFYRRRAIATYRKTKAKHLIHTQLCRPAITVGRDNSILVIGATLKCAQKPQIKSIAFPRLGTDVGGLRS